MSDNSKCCLLWYQINIPTITSSRNLYRIFRKSGYSDTFFLSQQYRNNERLLYVWVTRLTLPSSGSFHEWFYRRLTFSSHFAFSSLSSLACFVFMSAILWVYLASQLHAGAGGVLPGEPLTSVWMVLCRQPILPSCKIYVQCALLWTLKVRVMTIDALGHF